MNIFALTDTVTEAVTEVLTDPAAAEFVVSPMNFVTNLKWMGMGMLGIFIVMGAIILCTVALNKALAPKKDANKADEQ
ncbi:MAG: hypothetical protein IJ493_00315 [Clostridia bacterium]|nr:hypothetical protein [Clostridia bacterium]